MISELSGDQMGMYSHQGSPSSRESAPLSASSIQRPPPPDSPPLSSIITVLSSARNRGCRNIPSGPAGRASPDRSIQVGWERSEPAPEMVTDTPVSGTEG